MRQYVDAGFGFSFWYPATWTVKQQRVADPTRSGWYRGGRAVKELSVTSPPKPVDNGFEPDSVGIEVLSVPDGELTELGSRDTSNPVGADMTFSFQPKADTKGDAGEMETMAGLPIFFGASRHDAEVIVPLDRTHFVALFTNDPGGNMDHLYIAETIMAGGVEAAKRAGPQVRADAVHLEAIKLGVIGQTVGLGYWHKDSEHVYNDAWKIIPGADVKMFAPLSQEGPGGFFATDGIHVYDANGTAIPGADPKTFVVNSLDSARDAHHTYEGINGALRIDGVAVRK